MRINTPFTQGEFTADYQGVAKDQFLSDKKLGVCWQEVNFLSTNSQLLVDKKLEVCNILIIRDDFFLYKKDIRTYILLAFFMPRSLPEITLLVVDENKQCNHPQHYLYRITSLLVFRSNILEKELDHSS